MKRLFLLLALALSAIVILFPPAASAGGKPSKVDAVPIGHKSLKADITCSVNYYNSCYGPWNNWNHHLVTNYGPTSAYCTVFQPDGSKQSYGYVYPGNTRDYTAWVYNRILCIGGTTAWTTIRILDTF